MSEIAPKLIGASENADDSGGWPMPKFLEDKLKREYPNNPRAVYGTMNKIGAMHGNKETAKGRQMEAKHERDMGKMRTHGYTEHSHKGSAGRKPSMRHS